MDRRYLFPPIFILLFIVSAFCGTALMGRLGLPSTLFLNACWIISSLLAAVTCFRCATKVIDTGLRHAWRLFGAGCTSWFVGQILWSYTEITTGHVPAFAGWCDAGYVGAGLFFLASFYFFSGRNSNAFLTARKLCNLAILCCCNATIVLLLCGNTIIARQNESTFLLAVLGWGVLMPAAFMGGLLCLWLYTPSFNLQSIRLLVTGTGLMAVAMIEYALQWAENTYYPGNLGDYLYLVAFGLFIWAAREQTLTRTAPVRKKSIQLGYLEPAMPAFCTIAVISVAFWVRWDLEALLPYLVPSLLLLAISVGVRDTWSAHVEKQLFKQLRESEHRFRQVVDSNMNGIVFANQSGRIIDANNAFLDILGYSRADLQGGLVNWKQLTPPEFAEREREAEEEVARRGVCTPYEKEYFRKDGTRIPVLIGGALLPDATGRSVAFVVDLTARKNTERALQETQARLQAALDHLPFSFWSMDRSGRYTYQNAVSMALWGDQRGRCPEDFTHDSALLEERIDNYKRAFAGEVIREEAAHVQGMERRFYTRIVVPIREDNEITEIFGVNIDRTTEKQAHLRLEESETRYRNLAEHSAVGIWHFDEAGRTVYANYYMLALLGLERLDDLTGQPCTGFMGKASQAIWLRECQKTPCGTPCTCEVELVRQNGEPIPVLVSCVPQMHADGHTLGFIATFTDLRELKRTQRALECSERRFRAMVENASDGIAAWDAQGVIRYATPAITRLLGYAPEEIIDRPVLDFFHPEDVAKIEESRRVALQANGSQVRAKTRVRHKNGTWRQCEGVLTNLLDDPAVGALVVNFHDITERQQAEDALRESEARLHAFMENSPTRMFIKDRCGRYLHVNKTWLHAFSIPQSGIGRTDWEIFPAEVAKMFAENDRQTFASGQPMQFEELVIEQGKERSFIVQKFPLRDATGEINALGGIATDITERVRAERALRFSEERYRSLVNDARDAIFTLSLEGILTSANPAAEALTGISNNERLNQPFIPMVDKSDKAKAMSAFLSVLSGQKVENLELMIVGAGDRRVLMEFTATPQFDRGEIVGVLGIGRDITERRTLEEQLRHSQKLDSVGKLAGGIAHDFNNLLTVILGNASLIEDANTLPPLVLTSVQEIAAAADRAAALTRQLLAFSRRQLIQPRDLDVSKVIGDLAKMLQRILGEDIALAFETASKLPPVHADAGMLEQILLNLAVNARDAMPHGGQLKISTNQVEIGEADVRKNTEARTGCFVRISVADTGCGIAPEHLPHIFEPFFTTKDVGKGTGLGLSTVYGIVKQHQGWVSVQSTVDGGTIFHIHLPAGARQMANTSPNMAPANAMPRGTETILVVEDEAPLRAVVKVVLSRLGYRVIEAASGVEALKLWSEHREKIDLVFTDLVMPDGVSGQQLAEQLQKERSDLRVLFTSGYSAQMLARNGRLPEGAQCLQKPYLPPALASAVRAALTRNTSPSITAA